MGSSFQVNAVNKGIGSKLDPAQRSMDRQIAAILSTLEEKRRTIRNRLAALHDEERTLLDEKVVLDHAIARLTGEVALSDSASTQGACGSPKKNFRLPYGSITSIIVHLLSEAQDRGMTVDELVAAAKRSGVELNRRSIASSLSKFVREDVLDYKDRRYRLKSCPDGT